MDIFHVNSNQVTQLDQTSSSLPAHGFLWIDVTHDEVAADTSAWRDAITLKTAVEPCQLPGNAGRVWVFGEVEESPDG